MRFDRTTNDYPITLDESFSNDSEAALVCPRCNENYLHLTGLNAFGGEDAQLRFECEHCDTNNESWLIFSVRQHKGFSMVCWTAKTEKLSND